MGNLHFVTQIKPKVHKNGAVIKVIKGKEKTFETKYQTLFKDNTSLSRPDIEIKCPNINESANTYIEMSDRLYLVVRSGSKHGYQNDLRKIFKTLSKWLEDALFYIEDEYSQYVEKFEIKKGRFINELVVSEDGNLIDYYEKNHSKKTKTLLELLKTELADKDEYLHYGWLDTIKETITLANRAMKIDKKDWQIWHVKGRAYMFSGKFESAMKCFNKALKLKKESLEKGKEDYDMREIYCSMAYNLNHSERYKEAIEYCKVANEIYPHFGNQLPQEYMGYAYLNMKQFDKALEIFNELLRTASRKTFIAYALYNKACALTGLGKFGQAAGYVSAATSMIPHFFPKELVKDPDMKPLLDYKSFKRLMGDEYQLIKQAKENLDG